MNVAKNISYLPPKPSASTLLEGPKYPALPLSLVRLAFSTFGRVFPGPASQLAYKLFSTPRMRAKHRASDPVIEKARLFELLYGGHILKAYEWGTGTKTILLVHGWESRGTALRSFVPQLLDKGYRVIAFDGPAHGNSGGKRTNLSHFGGAIRAVINHIGGVHGIITHSFGGASTVFALWKIDPSIVVDKLVLIAVPNRVDGILETVEQVMHLPRAASKKFQRILEAKLNTSLKDNEVAKATGNIQLANTLLVHDKKDNIVDFSEAEAIFSKWDNASMLVTEGYGHYRLVKHPTVIERIVEFME